MLPFFDQFKDNNPDIITELELTNTDSSKDESILGTPRTLFDSDRKYETSNIKNSKKCEC